MRQSSESHQSILLYFDVSLEENILGGVTARELVYSRVD